MTGSSDIAPRLTAAPAVPCLPATRQGHGADPCLRAGAQRQVWSLLIHPHYEKLGQVPRMLGDRQRSCASAKCEIHRLPGGSFIGLPPQGTSTTHGLPADSECGEVLSEDGLAVPRCCGAAIAEPSEQGTRGHAADPPTSSLLSGQPRQAVPPVSQSWKYAPPIRRCFCISRGR
jgi:hypothetical protein